MARFHTGILVSALFAAALSGAAPARAQMSESELVMRINRLENQVRQLTGTNEQLQYRNQQLEEQLARLQQAGAPPAQARGPAAPAPQAQYAPPQPQYAPPPQPQYAPQVAAQSPQGYPPQPAESYPPGPPPARGRRGDAFDPNQNPNAAGAPRTLGQSGTLAPAPPLEDESEPPYVGAPGGRQAGAPLDIATMSEEAASAPPPRREIRQIPGAPPPVAPRNPPGQQMVMAPSNTPKDEYDLAYGYVLRKDYALAEESLRAFLKKHPSDRQVAEANYWLGESLFQRQRYREAAESFLNVSTKFENSGKAPDSLLRLGQSLAALKEKEAACATLGEITRKYPKATANVKQAAERELKRTGC
jgi:tol-pal system protein YbgF